MLHAPQIFPKAFVFRCVASLKVTIFLPPSLTHSRTFPVGCHVIAIIKHWINLCLYASSILNPPSPTPFSPHLLMPPSIQKWGKMLEVGYRDAPESKKVMKGKMIQTIPSPKKIFFKAILTKECGRQWNAIITSDDIALLRCQGRRIQGCASGPLPHMFL